jgi:hypothetical protein
VTINPELKRVFYDRPLLVKPKTEKELAEDRLPWKMFSQYALVICASCKNKTSVSFWIAKTQEAADKVLQKGKGYCPTCICRPLTVPRVRIATTDDGIPNPAQFSPFRLFGFASNERRKCACGKERYEFFVIARDELDSQKRVKQYGMCGQCMAELLCLDRYYFQTTDGKAPIMPTLMRAANPAIKKLDEEAEEDKPYPQIPIIPKMTGPMSKNWIPVPDEIVLDTILADGKPHGFLVMRGWQIVNNRLSPLQADHIIEKNKAGYSVWSWNHIDDIWHKVQYKSMEDLATHPKSVIGMALFMGPTSALYYSKDMVIPAKVQKNPVAVFQPKYKEKVLHDRKLFAGGGNVFLAKVETDKGNYAVWADDEGSFYSNNDFRKKYGWPARFDMRFHPHYHQAMGDYLNRRTLNRPVPLKGGS